MVGDGDDGDPSEDDSSSQCSNSDIIFRTVAVRIGEDNQTRFIADDSDVQNVSDKDWTKLGRCISKSTTFTKIALFGGALNDQRISCLFQGLTKSDTMEHVDFSDNGLSVAGVRSMERFLQNSNNLIHLDLTSNNIQSEGFNLLIRALHDSPIEELHCEDCGIHSIEIDNEYIPQHLKRLHLDGNNIDADGCRELAKLLQGGDTMLEYLGLSHNKVDCHGVELLVDALQNNTSLI